MQDGADLLLDGRKVQAKGYENGNFIGATVISLNLKQKIKNYENTLKKDEKGSVIEGVNEGDIIGKMSLSNPLNVTNRAYIEEIFGPVLFCVHVNTLEEAISFTNNSKYGNGCAIFTQR